MEVFCIVILQVVMIVIKKRGTMMSSTLDSHALQQLHLAMTVHCNEIIYT